MSRKSSKLKVQIDRTFSFRNKALKKDYPYAEQAKKKAKEVTKMLDSLLDREAAEEYQKYNSRTNLLYADKLKHFEVETANDFHKKMNEEMQTIWRNPKKV